MVLSPKCFTYILSKSAQFTCLHMIILNVFLASEWTDQFMKVIHLMNGPDKMKLCLKISLCTNGSRTMLLLIITIKNDLGDIVYTTYFPKNT